MNITKSLKIGKERITSKEFLSIRNIVPLQWYYIITTRTQTASGNARPVHNAISILSEIVYRYRSKVIRNYTTSFKKVISKFSGYSWRTSYEHFEMKFNYNKQRIRRAIIRLDELKLIKRKFQNNYRLKIFQNFPISPNNKNSESQKNNFNNQSKNTQNLKAKLINILKWYGNKLEDYLLIILA
ncbi:MAG TPA: hypothetical protein LFW20_01220 [Rickettsia endosymbiont of Omalisus fontisbellaquei]|nr:hypothetical protein [Rickettsia endosymbiont of Omalisus fontisbellaquei]